MPAMSSRRASQRLWSARAHCWKSSSDSATMCSAFHFGVDGVVVKKPADARKPGGETGDDAISDVGAVHV